MIDALAANADVLVFGLAVLLYLTDLGRLLYANEVLFCGSGRLRPLLPRQGFRFLGRFAVFPRFLDPGTVTLAFTWPSASMDASGIEETLARHRDQLADPRLACRLLLPLIFVGVPVVYAMPNNAIPLLVTLAMIYFKILVLIAWLFWSRKRLNLPMRACVMWAFESLVCIPYAINLHRKLSAHLLAQIRLDVLDAGRELLAPNDFKRLATDLATAINDDRMNLEASETATKFRKRVWEAAEL